MSDNLIISLNDAISKCKSYEQLLTLKTMKIKEMERILKEEANWDASKKIYRISKGYFKTKTPKQILNKDKNKIIEKMYEHFFGSEVKTYTLEYCFKQSMEDFVVEVEANEKASTSKAIYLSNWKRFFLEFPIAQKDITKIKKIELVEHLKSIVRKFDLSRRGLNDAKTILNKAFDWASNHDIITHPVSRDISTKNIRCKTKNNSALVYNDEERETLLALMEQDDHVASRALSLMFCLCARSGEIRALKWSDVDWKNETIYIHTQISRSHDENGHNIYIDAGVTKNRDVTGNRYQQLSDKAISILKKQKSLQPFSTYIFEYNGHVLEPNMLNRRLKKLCNEANITYLSTHKIRFWSVTKMCASGVNPAEIQAQAGHKDFSTTMYYIRAGKQGVLEKSIANEMFG